MHNEIPEKGTIRNIYYLLAGTMGAYYESAISFEWIVEGICVDG